MALGNLFFPFFCPRNPIFVQAVSKKAKCGSSSAPGRSAHGLPDSPTGVECAKMLQVPTLLPPAPSLPTPSNSGASGGCEHARQLPLNGVAPTAKLTTGGVSQAGGQRSFTQPRTGTSTRVLASTHTCTRSSTRVRTRYSSTYSSTYVLGCCCSVSTALLQHDFDTGIILQ